MADEPTTPPPTSTPATVSPTAITMGLTPQFKTLAEQKAAQAAATRLAKIEADKAKAIEAQRTKQLAADAAARVKIAQSQAVAESKERAKVGVAQAAAQKAIGVQESKTKAAIVKYEQGALKTIESTKFKTIGKIGSAAFAGIIDDGVGIQGALAGEAGQNALASGGGFGDFLGSLGNLVGGITSAALVGGAGGGAPAYQSVPTPPPRYDSQTKDLATYQGEVLEGQVVETPIYKRVPVLLAAAAAVVGGGYLAYRKGWIG